METSTQHIGASEEFSGCSKHTEVGGNTRVGGKKRDAKALEVEEEIVKLEREKKTKDTRPLFCYLVKVLMFEKFGYNFCILVITRLLICVSILASCFEKKKRKESPHHNEHAVV
ncbi:unnamed protein product [Lactuca saligna]|uniref:Uncharacterized protein n=1 Tax=Lactuca saligna TaxID=75948 RepID=A0AA36EFJ4_LACSI|nr:unnamed protein product [Lactuca saligna]